MENYKNNQEDNIDLLAILNKAKSYWYLFAVSIILFLAIGFVYNKYSERTYAVDAILMFDKTEAGSSPIDEIMEGDAYRKPENTLFVTNQVAIIKSDNLIQDVVKRLDQTVTYYTVESFWPGFLEESWLNEAYDNFPFEVEVDSSANQLTGQLINVEVLSEGQVKISAEGKEVSIYNFAKGGVVNKVENIVLEETINVGDPFVSNYLNITLKKKDGVSLEDFSDQNLFFKISSQEALAKQWQEKLSLELTEKLTEDPREQPRVVSLVVESNVPRKGVEFMGQLISAYSEVNLDRKNSKGEKAITFLNEKIRTVSDSLKKAEENLESFRASSTLVDVDAARSSIYSNLNDLEKERAEIRNQLNYYQSTLQNLNDESASGRITAPSTYGIDNAILNKLIDQYLLISTRLNELEYNLKVENPLVKQLRQQMTDLKDAIAQNLRSSMDALKGQQNILNSRIGSMNSNISALPKNERTLARLEREYEQYSQRYNFLVDKRTEAQLTLDSNTPDFEVIQQAKVGDNPTWPNANLVYALALALGLIFPLGFVFFKEKVSDNILAKDELESRTKAPLLGMIANGPSKVKVVKRTHANTAIAESFKFARINLQYFHQGSNNKIIGITSSISGEGKTFCATNLSVAFADSGQRTLLICGDLRKPRIHEYFNLKGVGVTDFVEERASLEDVIQATEFRNLDIIAPGALQSDAVNLFESKKMEEMFSQLRERYDRIIVETPPIGFVVDYFVLLKYFDINLFVVRYNFTKKNILEGINDLYNNHKIKNLYILFNDVKSSSNSYYGQINGAEGYYGKLSKAGSPAKLKNPFSN